MPSQDEYLVAFLQAKRSRKRGRRRVAEYKVRWAEPFDDPRFDSWEPADNILNPALVQQFERRRAEGRMAESQFSQPAAADAAADSDSAAYSDDADDAAAPAEPAATSLVDFQHFDKAFHTAFPKELDECEQ